MSQVVRVRKNRVSSRAGASSAAREQRMELTTITPAMAKEWFVSRAQNRKLKPIAIARYKTDILSGNWLLTGEAIKINHRGKVIDGQNRLAAAIEANTSIVSWVCYNVDDQAMDVLDSGHR
jgi:hypothetical protein